LVKNSAKATTGALATSATRPRPPGARRTGAAQRLGRDLQQVRQLLEIGQLADQADDGVHVARLGGAQLEGGGRGHGGIVQRPSAGADSRAGHPGLQCAAMTAPYHRRAPAPATALPVRGLHYHLHSLGRRRWSPGAVPPLVMLHGWMDVGASFQFVVDALARRRRRRAACWRPTGAASACTERRHRQLLVPDYLGDLDALLDRLWPDGRPGRPARPQHGRQRGDELRRRAAGTHPPPGQPGRLRPARHAARPGAGPRWRSGWTS
jgi:hypothetical protein